MALLRIISTGLLTAFAAFSANTAPQTGINLERYLGRWYEQARYENWFEKGMENVYTIYSPGPDGSIVVKNIGTSPEGAVLTTTGRAFPDGTGQLAISFVWPYFWFRTPYRILYVNENYTAALVSCEGDEYLWLLTREQAPDKRLISTLIREAQRRGFDTAKLRITRQD